MLKSFQQLIFLADTSITTFQQYCSFSNVLAVSHFQQHFSKTVFSNFLAKCFFLATFQQLISNFLASFQQFSTTFQQFFNNFLATFQQFFSNFLANFQQLFSNFLATFQQNVSFQQKKISEPTCSFQRKFCFQQRFSKREILATLQ